MTPRDFEQAIAAAPDQGVLVGFEFEVGVPAETFSARPRGNQISPEQFVQYFYDQDYEYLSVGDWGGIDQLSRLFPFRPGASKYANFKEVYNWQAEKMHKRAGKMQERAYKTLNTIKELFEKIPANVRAKSMDQLKQDPRFDFDFSNAGLEQQLRYAMRLGEIMAPQLRRGSEMRLRAYEISGHAETALEEMGSEDLDDLTFRDLFDTAFPRGRILAMYRQLDFSPEEIFNAGAFDGPSRESYDEWDDGDDDDSELLYKAAATFLKPQLSQAVGAQVHVFSEYHQKTKNLKDWYIEPDGSLDANEPNDATAEIVSPPLRADQAMTALKNFYSFAKQFKLYTNESTGLHINISIPAKLDAMKLALFLGDEHVLRQFGREDNEYANSVMKSLQNPKRYQRGPGNWDLPNQAPAKTAKGSTGFNFEILQRVAAGVQSAHTASISNNGKYISFRHAGGNYLADYSKIVNTIGRFIRAMLIASDPDAYRQEYLTKLSQLLGTAGQLPGAQSQASATRLSSAITALYLDIKANGLAADRMYAVTDMTPSAALTRIQKYLQQHFPAQAASTQIQHVKTKQLLTQVQNTPVYRSIDQYDEDEYRNAFVITPLPLLTVAQVQQATTLEQLANIIAEYFKARGTAEPNENDISHSWRYTLALIRDRVQLPPGDSSGLNVMRALIEQYKKLSAQAPAVPQARPRGRKR